jgi:DNA-directed RNA polymerase specialized sigma24 family protein
MGMTLRDYFASKAMQALLHPEYKDIIRRTMGCDVSAEDAIKGIVLCAYQHADAMLAERAKPVDATPSTP